MSRPSRPIIAALLAILLAGGLAGTWWWQRHLPPQLGAERWVTLYYLDSQGMYLVPVETRLSLPTSPERALETALNAIAKAPDGLMAPLPPESKVQVTAIKGGTAEVLVQIGGVAPGGGVEQLLANALVRTASAIDSVHEVQLQLLDSRGNALSSEHMDLSQPLSPTDPGMDNLYLGGEGLAMTIYYRLPKTSYLVPVRVPLPKDRTGEPLAGSFALLMAGPPQELSAFLASSVEPLTDLRWNGIEGDVAQILWKNAPQATPSPLTLRALALTLTDSGRLKAIRLKAEGLPLRGTSGPFDLSRPIARPASVNPGTATP